MVPLGSGSERPIEDFMLTRYACYLIAQTESRPFADFLPTLTIAAKNLATEMTNHNVIQDDLQGEGEIAGEHVQNNLSVREMLKARGIKPEHLLPEEDVMKLERRVKSEEKN
jgi:DNA-damage-inducible protein D